MTESSISNSQRRDLPAGTVTILFTDIQGSTELLKHLGDDGYIALVSEHHNLMRQTIDRYHGTEVRTQGDSFFVTFPRAPDAVAAAVDIQLALSEHSWPEGVKVRVRMGLHTGHPLVAVDDYSGIDIHRAARIAAIGHGGQVLLSETTAPLVRDDLPKGVTLRDLGRHQLKDMTHPERIRQLVISGLQDCFPPLKSLKALDPEKDRSLVELDDETLLNITLCNDDPDVRSEAVLVYASRGHRGDVEAALLDQVEQGKFAAFGALVALADEYGMPKVDSSSLKIQILLAVTRKRWRKYRSNIWVQTRKAALGGGLLFLYGAAMPLLMRLTSNLTYQLTLTFMSLTAYYLISIILFGLYGLVQGAALGFGVGLGDALFSRKFRARGRTFFGAISGVVSALYFSATQLLREGPVPTDPSLVFVTNLIYGLLLGLILAPLIPSFHSGQKSRNRTVQIGTSMLLLALLMIPYVMIIYKADYLQALPSRILLALAIPITFTLPFNIAEEESEPVLIDAA